MEYMNHQEITTLWSRLIVEELVRNGITMFCISPGSRSTPLTVAAARHPKTVCRMFPDERAAGFFALGYARAARTPAVLICTSGTAAANYYPAIVEASMDHQPLLVLTADRPAELRETGANQTIRQQGMYAGYTRWQFQLPEPSETFPAAALLSAIDHAAASCRGFSPGPVHLNVPLREPLNPAAVADDQEWTLPLDNWKTSGAPWSSTTHLPPEPENSALKRIADILSAARRPLVIAGRLDDIRDAQAVLDMTTRLNLPLYADISSQLRFHRSVLPLQLAWVSDRFLEQNRADAVLHIGGPLVGKKPAEVLKAWRPDHLIVIRNHPDRYGPDHNITLSIESAPAAFARELERNMAPRSREQAEIPQWAARAEADVDRLCSNDLPVTEISAARQLSSIMDPSHALFLANSMPVRDMDMYGARHQPRILPVAMNRGASGIDGLIATAAGFAEASGSPGTLLIGDISFLHDLNSLNLLSASEQPLLVVVINNNGGGIFSFLPIASEKDVFEEHFATPQQFSIASAAKTFGLDYATADTNSGFCSTYRSMSHSGRPGIVEIRTDRHANLRLHRELNTRLAAVIGPDHAD